MTSKLELINKSIRSMSKNEQLAMLEEIRRDRKRSKAPIVRERKQLTEMDKLLKVIDKMPEEQRVAMIAALQAQ